jgi:mRNA-degrading endonuclease RelE of RelBE toxin-antitoxin system
MQQWTVILSRSVKNSIRSLDNRVSQRLLRLIREIELNGPVRGNWPNYSKLTGDRHHCHIKKGRPTYVAVWVVRDKEIRIVEVIYAGTHERAPY